MFDQAEQAVRYWTTQQTPQAIYFAFQLFHHMATQLHHEQPELIQVVYYWDRGAFPRATSLLNALMDAWRIAWQQSIISDPTPFEALEFVKEMDALQVPVECRSFTYPMQAALQRPFTPDVCPAVFCEDILAFLLVRGSEQDNYLPDRIAWTITLNAWAKSPRPDAAQRAMQLWQLLLDLQHQRKLRETPNTILYNAVLEALTKTRQLADMEQAETILMSMMETPFPEVVPDTVSYRLVVFGWNHLAVELFAQQRQHKERRQSAFTARDAMERAFRVVKLASRDVKEGQPVIDASFFSMLISTLSRHSRDYADHKRAEEIFHYLNQQHERTKHVRFQPDAHIMKAMLILYAKTDRPKQAQAVLQHLEAMSEQHKDPTMLPKRGHYRDLIQAWIRSKSWDAPKHTQTLVSRLLDLALQPGNSDYILDPTDIDSALKKVSRGTGSGVGKRTEQLFRKLQTTYRKSGDARLEPLPIHYLRVMYAYSQADAPNGSQRIQSIWKELHQWCCENPSRKLDCFDCTAAVSALSRVRPLDATTLDQISSIVEQAQRNYQQTGNETLRPDTMLYQAALKACRAAGDSERAESIFLSMLLDHDSGNKLVQPTSRHLNITLAAWLYSKQAQTADRVRMLVERVGNRNDVRPDELTQDLLRKIFHKD
ncbi:hypothetical protein FisN_21Lh033 [Fistulifera solaris]|uniref:Pentacotripeptide-repeat region of PRORP domain-containing protein n=1 Tax=Fistulifera solaris TaxID=1519565 RepID=A0A1Z5KKB5_FISSO|nr:hypothetical protein FisN_21Lh033 [Fistulifera solaris]|eukprot:GAX26565.1 hypothetical protein FisN_21Lh033 [Fistulifera solaris]